MADMNLEDVLEQLQFNYGGVLQELARLHDEVVNQIEILKTAGTKIRRKETEYASGAVLVCVGKENGSKSLLCISGGTTGSSTYTEDFYNLLQINQEISDGTVRWKCIDNLASGTTATYDYTGPFHVSQIIISGTTSPNVNCAIIDDSRKDSNGNYLPGGNIIIGDAIYSVRTESDFVPKILADGDMLYLHGSSAIGSAPIFEYIAYPMSSPIEDCVDSTIQDNEFYTQLAYNSGGKLIQTQFGDITTIPWGIGEYQGAFKAERLEDGEDGEVYVKIYDPSRITYDVDIEGSTVIDSSIAGRIVIGSDVYTIPTIEYLSVSNGERVYLWGSSGLSNSQSITR